MNPRLIAIAGPMEGAFYSLPELEVTIGSDPSNMLALEQSSVLPRHSVIDGRGDGFVLRNAGAQQKPFIHPLTSGRIYARDDGRATTDALMITID